MQAEVNTHDRNAERLPQVARVRLPDASRDTSLDRLADERVHTIIAANAAATRAVTLQ